MHADSSFKARLLLFFWGAILLAALLPSAWSYLALSRDIETEAVDQAKSTLHQAVWALRSARGPAEVEALRSWVAEAGRTFAARITVVAPDGSVVADSEVPEDQLAALENHGSRPEILEAERGGVGVRVRHSDTLDRDLIYVAVRLEPGLPAAGGFLRLALPKSLIQDRLEEMRRNFFWIILASFAAAMVLAHLATRSFEHSIRALIQAAEAIGQGQYDRRIRTARGREFGLLAEAINWMAERISGHVRTITEQRDELEGVLDGMREGVLVLDGRGRIRSANRSMAAVAPEVERRMGSPLIEAMHEPVLQDLGEEMLRPGGPASRSMRLTLEGDRVFSVNAVRAGRPDSGDDAPAAILVFHDETELQRLERVRRDFVANVSHELRTPLTAIKGYAETLLEDPPPPPEASRTFLEVIRRNADHMAKMADDLLSLSRLESGKERFEPRALDASAALRMAWESCLNLAGDQEAELQLLFPETLPRVLADQDQLVRVFRNLLENAVKFGPKGGLITASARSLGAFVEFEIRDRGPGIPQHDQPRIFERFYSVEKHRRNEFGSTGLGLAICRHIVRRHGGEIRVQSPPEGEDRGSAFLFTLPVA